jgi:CubicO group peptidase (beta-lactamase class C family)
MGTKLAQSFALTSTWGASNTATGVIDQTGALYISGDTEYRFRLASISKLITAWSALIAVEDGSVSLDDHVGQEGCTLRHLLCHAGGYGFDNGAPIISPGRKRVYSNTAYEMLAAHVSAHVEMEFDEYVFVN